MLFLVLVADFFVLVFVNRIVIFSFLVIFVFVNENHTGQPAKIVPMDEKSPTFENAFHACRFAGDKSEDKNRPAMSPTDKIFVGDMLGRFVDKICRREIDRCILRITRGHVQAFVTCECTTLQGLIAVS